MLQAEFRFYLSHAATRQSTRVDVCRDKRISHLVAILLLYAMERMRLIAEEWKVVAEVLAEYPAPLEGENDVRYIARAVGAEADDGLWQGWIEFVPLDGEGPPVRSPRETTQPNRTDLEYWATGLTPVYLEGSLRRALNPLQVRPPAMKPEPVYDEPAPAFVETPSPPRPREPILNPFSVYQKGEALLRKQLSALSAWHLANIAKAYDLVPDKDADRFSHAALVELIVSAVKRRSETLP
jgi:hypothetical protein